MHRDEEKSNYKISKSFEFKWKFYQNKLSDCWEENKQFPTLIMSNFSLFFIWLSLFTTQKQTKQNKTKSKKLIGFPTVSSAVYGIE